MLSPIGALAVAGVLLLALTTPAAADVNQARADANWIRTNQLSDGSITVDSNRNRIEPYVANYAAQGLARASISTGDKRYVAAAWRWLSWYRVHQQPNGLVDEFNVTSGALQDTKQTDSVDGSGGTFLLALRESYRASQDINQLATYHTAIQVTVSGIAAMLDSDGLTWALPSWHVKYLMDQAEAYGGLRAAADLATTLGDTALASQATGLAATIQTGVAGLWNDSTGAYDWAKHGSGVRIPTNWSVLYPDSVEQAWSVEFGLAPSVTAQALMNAFTRAQPTWSQPFATGTYYDGYTYQHTVDYWPSIGTAYDAAGQAANANAGLASIRSTAINANYAPPLTSGNVGQIILLETGGL